MENKMIWSVIRAAVLTAQLVTEVLAAVFVLTLNMLPTVYLIVFLAVLVLLAEGTVLLMFVRVKDRIRLWRKIVSCILSVLIIIGCAMLSKFAWDAHGFMGTVTGGNDSSDARNTYALVLNDNSAHSLKDTTGYLYGAVEAYDIEHTQAMIEEIEKATSEKINLSYYKQASLLVDALYNKQVDAVIMNGASLSLLIEQDNYSDFLSQVRILSTLSYTPDVPKKDEPANTTITKTPFVVYVSGSDTRSQMLDVGRSDVNILVVVNPTTKQILLINTPRDYYIPNPAGNGKLDKLTHCSNYGVNCSIEALETLYQTDIDYYGRINFSGFERLIDSIGGIVINSDESFWAQGIYINAGKNQLNGEQALKFARERYNVSGGDNGRGKNQMKVIKAVIEKVTSSTTLISKYAEILKSLEGMLSTDFETDEISQLVKMQLQDMAAWDIQSFAVTGTGDYQVTYSAPGESLWVMQPNEKSVNYAIGLINRVMDGETLTSNDMKLPK